MGRDSRAKLLCEREIIIPGETRESPSSVGRAVRSLTFNATESPLGWLFARGFVSQRQFDAGERLRSDWERAQLAPRVTMAWDSAPISRGRRGSPPRADLSGSQIDARRRFDDAVAAAG